MPLSGRVFKVENALALVPILLGDIPPLFGFSPWSGATVTATLSAQILFFEISITRSATTAADGSFSISSDIPSEFASYPFQASLAVSSGVPLYRSDPIPLPTATSGKLNFWLFPDSLPTSDGVTAGSISSLIGSSLPGSTSISSSPAGLHFSGISEPGVFGISNQVQIDFGLTITPDTSTNLQSFLDPSITFANINIDFPTSLFTSYNDILQMLQEKIAGAGSSMNSAVLAKMEGILETDDHVTPATAQKFLTQEVSVTFMDVTFPNQHTWGIGDTSDPTVVIAANPCLGFPRILTPGEPVL